MAPDPYLLAVAALLTVWAGLVAVPVTGRGGLELSATQLGYLRRGARGALRTAVVHLHANGLVRVRGRGVIARGDAPMRAGGDGFARAVYAAIPTPTRLGVLPGRSRVRAALAKLVGRLARAGLVPGRVRWTAARAALLAAAVVSVVRLRDPGVSPAVAVACAAALPVTVGAWFTPRRTVAGRRRLVASRREHAEVLAMTGEELAELDAGRAAVGYACGGAVAPELSRAFARPRLVRSADDHPSERDYDGAWRLYNNVGSGPM